MDVWQNLGHVDAQEEVAQVLEAEGQGEDVGICDNSEEN